MDLIEITENQNRHPWEISRTKQLVKQCCKVIKNSDQLQICDIGSGDRYFDLQLLRSLEERETSSMLHAVDSNYEDLNSVSDNIQLHKDISNIAKNYMDIIVMMDVLEHIEDDLQFMGNVQELLKENGTLVITVPAYASLFSSHDTFLKHFRRYELMNLKRLLQESKMNIEKCHYFYSSLFIIRWLQVKLRKGKSGKANAGIGMWKHSEKSLITIILTGILNLDFSIHVLLNRVGIILPGLSLFCVASKPKK